MQIAFGGWAGGRRAGVVGREGANCVVRIKSYSLVVVAYVRVLMPLIKIVGQAMKIKMPSTFLSLLRDHALHTVWVSSVLCTLTKSACLRLLLHG